MLLLLNWRWNVAGGGGSGAGTDAPRIYRRVRRGLGLGRGPMRIVTKPTRGT